MNRSSYIHATSKTRRRIEEAFAELLAERGSVKNISVTDLADRADITRGTFYNYYNNIYEVGAELQKEIEQKLFIEYDNVNTFEDLEHYIDTVFLFFKQNEGLHRELLFSNNAGDYLAQIETRICKNLFSTLEKRHLLDDEKRLDLLFLTNGTVAMVRKYFQGSTDLTLEDIRDYLKKRIISIIG